MAKGLCPKCGEPKENLKRSYCKKCENVWQNERNRIDPPKPRTPEQHLAQLKNDRERIARMTPEQKKEHYAKRQAARIKWINSNPEIRNRINETARNRRTSWTPEKLGKIKNIQQSHYARRMLRKEQGLCAYSTQCNNPPIGEHTHCLYHWMQVVCIAHRSRSDSDVSIDQFIQLWNSQNSKCAITGLPLIPGKNVHLDHITPVKLKGAATISNLRFIHKGINHMKWDMLDSEFAEFILSFGPHLVDWAKKILTTPNT